MEVWRTAIYNGEVYGDYEVSNMGNVRNIKTGRVLKPQKDKGGYLCVVLYRNGKHKQCKIHRLVAFAFIPNDDVEHKTDVNHISEVKTENFVENLEWCTRKENNNHGTHNERMAKSKSKKVIGKSLTENKVIVLQSTRQANKFGFDQSTISKCCKGKQRQHKGYVWSYID